MNDNPGWADRDFDNLNNHSVVVRVDFGESSFLFTGDLEEPAIETLVEYYADTDLLDVDVYLVGHHGSHNGTTPSLVAAMTPEVAVLGVGKSSFGRNRRRGFNTFSYGHPRRSVIELLSAAIPGRRSQAIEVEVADSARQFSDYRVTKRIYATGWDGDVTIAAKIDGTMRVTSSTTGLPPTLEPVPVAATAVPAAPRGVSDEVPVPAQAAAPPAFHWNLPAPEKKPSSGGNGKVVLFDASHGETAGQADWVIDGGFSDFADALVENGFTVREYRGVDRDGDGVVRFVDGRRGDLVVPNEATIEFAAIQEAAVFVMAETNRPLNKDERAALLQFVGNGGGLFLIADHYNADRNLNSWDATEVFNGYNRSTAVQFDMGGLYGDLRNPGNASKGWLAENFGIRFRFNAINCKSGVSDIVPPGDAEQVTKDVEPVLMAAGSTLAIVDPSRAKGLVYLSSDDDASGWPSAIEGEEDGLYFGGRKEGPYAAISKPSAGKVAFLGDSSPVEDNSPRYRNEVTGARKQLHNGWKSRGTAATLCLNLVAWLATPENYVGFSDTNGHPPGIPTPVAMAPVEEDDPADGRPWRALPSGYDPWNPDTFAPGSYGAPFPPGDSGSPSNPGTVIDLSEALATAEGEMITVEGIIQSELNDQFGLKLSDSPTSTRFLAVQLPSAFRDSFSPKINPSARGARVRVTGKRGRYMSSPGLRSVSEIRNVVGE
jgi:hypothetical protein